VIFPKIRKPAAVRRSAMLPDYDAALGDFGWEIFRSWLDYLPEGKLNIAYEAVDRHVARDLGDKEALQWPARACSKPLWHFGLARICR